MKLKYLTLLICAVALTKMYAHPDDILGEWVDEKKTGTSIYTKVSENKYTAVCGWQSDGVDKNGKPKLDKKNPDKSQRTKPVVGQHVMDVTYNPEKKQYNIDYAYDPSMGVALDDCGTIKISGDTMTIKAGWAFIKVTKKLCRVKTKFY